MNDAEEKANRDQAEKKRAAVTARALEVIKANFGSLRDLPKPLIPVVWVSIYRSVETAMRVEASGGPKAIVKDTLIGHDRLGLQLEEAALRIKFLKAMVPVIRAAKSLTEQLAASQLVIDILKWEIEDAADMSWLKRAILRQFAKPDPEYKRSLPPELATPTK